jgi:adenine-specific DNA-methyltransferase
MSNIYEQRFFSALKDTFIGHPIKGKSGYVNLMDLKAQYFSEIEPYIKAEIDKQIEAKYREELFEKLYNFFDCYLNETGTVFFANSQIHKNLYEKVYSDRDDVALFWKTQKLYYVKSEANYEDLQTEVNGINIKFDASEIKHAKGNEKKSIQFFMAKATKDEVVFKIRYQENNKYDRLKTYLELDKNNDIIDKCLDEYGTALHANIVFENTGIDRITFDKKGDQRKCLFIENLDDALESVKVEYSISDLTLMLQYLHKNGVILYDEDLKKIFSIYKRQNEIDYFIHKDAEGFLKEQFDIYVYNWLFNDLDTDFDAATVKRMQNIKKITHKVIEYIARFEDELKAIWEKPKFVRNCNYVLTLDRLSEHIDLIEKLIKSPDWEKQVEEWQSLNKEWQDDKGETTKKEWNEFAFANENDFEKQIIQKGKLNTKYQFLPIDTKFFPELKNQILLCFENLNNAIDGQIIKTDNWQGLNTIKPKFKGTIDLIYIDPPFNTGEDFPYKDSYQDSTWLSMMESRIMIMHELLNNSGSLYLHLDQDANYYGRHLLDNIFGHKNFLNEIIWFYENKFTFQFITYFNSNTETIFLYSKSNGKHYFKHVEVPVKNKRKQNKVTWDKESKKMVTVKDENGNVVYYESENKIATTLWNIPRLNSQANERLEFKTQKPEQLIHRALLASSENKGDLVADFFSGSGTTIATAHKTGRKWLATEMGEHFDGVNLPRMKKVLVGDKAGISKDESVDWQGGGFFKYYELEQYEEVLSKAQYQWQGKEGNIVEQYSFLQDQKLLEAIAIDYEKKNAKVVFEKLYPDVDIAETLSNLSGKHIKQLFEDKVVFEDSSEVVYAEMTFEKYPWIKPLIWWNSK